MCALNQEPLNQEFGESYYNTHRHSNWNVWDDFICAYQMDAPNAIPNGATKKINPYVTRPGEEKYA